MTTSARAAGALTVAITNAAEFAARGRLRHRAADLRRAGAQRRGDENVRRDGRGARSAHGAWADDDALAAALEPLAAAAGGSRRVGLERSACRRLPTPRASSPSAAGSTLAIAREAALKLKETCNRHAEAFSGAEFLHGPVALVSSRYPILMFMPTDAAAPGMRQLASDLRQNGHGAVHRRARRSDRHAAADACRRSTRGRRHLPDPELLCAWPCNWRSTWRSTSTGPGISGKSPAPHERIATTTPWRRTVSSTATSFCATAPSSSKARTWLRSRPARELPASMPVHSLPDGAWLAPGLHRRSGERRRGRPVQRCADSLRASAPSPRPIAGFGTTALLPTLISDTPDKMRAALAAAQSAAADNPSVLGIHFEGPFLSPEKPGVHDPSMFRRPDRARRRSAHVMARRRRARHAGARACSGRLHRRAGTVGRARLAWPFHGHLRADEGGACRRSHRRSRISSTRCARLPAASPGPSPPPSRRRARGSA